MVKLSGTGPILVVDDDEDALSLTEVVFGIASVPNRLVPLESGDELLRYLERVIAGQDEMPSIVLLDINMPDPDGFQTLEAVRRLPTFKDLPIIIMLTASNDVDDMQRAIRAGANGYQVKPFSVDDFVSFAGSLVPA